MLTTESTFTRIASEVLVRVRMIAGLHRVLHVTGWSGPDAGRLLARDLIRLHAGGLLGSIRVAFENQYGQVELAVDLPMPEVPGSELDTALRMGDLKLPYRYVARSHIQAITKSPIQPLQACELDWKASS